MNIRIRTGPAVQITSIMVLCDQRAGTGFDFLLKRTTTMISSASTNRVMTVMIGIRIILWKKMASCFSTDAAGCKSIAPGVG